MIVGGGARHIPGDTFQSAGCCCSLAGWLAGWLAWEGSKSSLAPFVYLPHTLLQFTVHPSPSTSRLCRQTLDSLSRGGTRRGTARAMQRAYSEAGNELNRHETQTGKWGTNVEEWLCSYQKWSGAKSASTFKISTKVSIRCCTAAKKQMIY